MTPTGLIAACVDSSNAWDIYNVAGANWNESNSWTPSSSLSSGNFYSFQVASNGTSWQMTIYAADDTTPVVTMPAVNWSATKSVTNSIWLAVGDLLNDTYYGTMNVDYIHVT